MVPAHAGGVDLSSDFVLLCLKKVPAHAGGVDLS